MTAIISEVLLNMLAWFLMHTHLGRVYIMLIALCRQQPLSLHTWLLIKSELGFRMGQCCVSTEGPYRLLDWAGRKSETNKQTKDPQVCHSSRWYNRGKELARRMDCSGRDSQGLSGDRLV